MLEKGNRSGLFRSMLLISTIPIAVFAIVISVFSANRFAGAMNKEVRSGLQIMGITVLDIYDELYPGDYRLVKEGSGLNFMKGEHQLNEDYAVMDRLKEQTGLDFSFFYEDTRVITTICDEAGNRIIAADINAIALEDVQEGGAEKFYPNIQVNNISYFAYFAPVFNSDGSCVGMIFVGKPTAEVNKDIQDCIMPNILITCLGIVIVGAVSTQYAGRMIGSIKKLQNFLGQVEQGNLSAELDREVRERKDEIGDMGRHVINMQKALRELVEMDILTQLNNRRYGEAKLKQVQKKANTSGREYTVVLADIDYFKQVNDTYGHECGDIVLRRVAAVLKRHMAGNGFAARWGGEEFLMVYDTIGPECAVPKLELIRQEIQDTAITYGKESVHITITMGAVPGSNADLDSILREADKRLYTGKDTGRNQVVAE